MDLIQQLGKRSFLSELKKDISERARHCHWGTNGLHDLDCIPFNEFIYITLKRLKTSGTPSAQGKFKLKFVYVLLLLFVYMYVCVCVVC